MPLSQLGMPSSSRPIHIMYSFLSLHIRSPAQCDVAGSIFSRCFFFVFPHLPFRFYQSCSSPPPPSSPPPRSPPRPLPPLPCSLPPCQLIAKLFANFRTQWPLLDLNCKGLSALGTAGPQPGTFRAQ